MFMDSMEDELSNSSRTENGALGYSTTNNPVLDLNFKTVSMRLSSKETNYSNWNKAYEFDKIIALKWLLYLRDARGGLGERKSFKDILLGLSNSHPELVTKLVSIIPEYGRFDDLFILYESTSEEVISELNKYIRTQLLADVLGMEENRQISLLAKWLPSNNTSSKASRALANKIQSGIGYSPRTYRKILSSLRSYIDVVETKMSSNNWSDIDYSKVPSKANLIYKDAFMKHDDERRLSYLDKVKNGEEKINSSVLFPHEIVGKYHSCSNVDDSLETLWSNLPNLVESNSRTLVMRDGSGSMECTVPGSKITNLDVATGLAIYFSEKLEGEFKDKFLTFSSHPELVDLSSCDTLKSKLTKVHRYNAYSNTNIKAGLNLILNTAVDNHLSQEDLPDTLLIISDMEFDRGCDYDQVLFKSIDKEYRSYNYKLPRLVFWNVGSRSNTIPLRVNELGVSLISGYSVNLVKMVMSGELDPYKNLLRVLNSDRYSIIDTII